MPAAPTGYRASGRDAPGPGKRGPPPGRPPSNPHRGCRLRAPSRCAVPKRSPWVASRDRSAHAARAPRTAAFDGSTVRHHSAVSRGAGSRSWLLRRLPMGRLQAQSLTSRRGGKIWIPCNGIILPRQCRGTASRSLRLAPAEKRAPIRLLRIGAIKCETYARRCQRSRSCSFTSCHARRMASPMPRRVNLVTAPVARLRAKPSRAPFTFRSPSSALE